MFAGPTALQAKSAACGEGLAFCGANESSTRARPCNEQVTKFLFLNGNSNIIMIVTAGTLGESGMGWEGAPPKPNLEWSLAGIENQTGNAREGESNC